MSEDPVKICSRERVKRANESGEWEVSDCKERTGTTVASKTRTNRERFARACSVRRSRYRSADRLQHSIEGTSAFNCFLGQSIVYAVVLLGALDDSVFGEYAEEDHSAHYRLTEEAIEYRGTLDAVLETVG